MCPCGGVDNQTRATDVDKEALIDGGDVLWTGREVRVHAVAVHMTGGGSPARTTPHTERANTTSISQRKHNSHSPPLSRCSTL